MTNFYYAYSEKLLEMPPPFASMADMDEINGIQIKKTILETCDVFESTYEGGTKNTLILDVDDSPLTILFNLGDGILLNESVGCSVQLDKNHYILLLMQTGISHRITFNAIGYFNIFIIQLKPAYLITLLNIRPLDPLLLRKPLRTSFTASEIIKTIITSQYEEPLRNLFYEAKVKEVIFHQIHDAEKMDKLQADRLPLFENDIKLLYNAKENIENNYQHPLTIPRLAKHIGINENKLKKGFKEVFNTTCHTYLRTVRMKHARELLKNGASIAEIAFRVGYENSANFSNAFKKFHGCTPSTYSKTYTKHPASKRG